MHLAFSCSSHRYSLDILTGNC